MLLTVWGRNSDLEEVNDSALEYDAFEQVDRCMRMAVRRAATPFALN